MPVRTLRCALENLEGWYPRLFLEPHIVAGVAVMSRYSAPPATFNVACEGVTSRWLGKDSAFRLKVSWAEQTAAKASRLLVTMRAASNGQLSPLASRSIIVH